LFQNQSLKLIQANRFVYIFVYSNAFVLNQLIHHEHGCRPRKETFCHTTLLKPLQNNTTNPSCNVWKQTFQIHHKVSWVV